MLLWDFVCWNPRSSSKYLINNWKWPWVHAASDMMNPDPPGLYPPSHGRCHGFRVCFVASGWGLGERPHLSDACGVCPLLDGIVDAACRRGNISG